MGKVILITGASTGIGSLTANELAKDNQIIIHYNSSQANAEKTASSVREMGGTPYLVQSDLSNDLGCIKVASFIKNNFDKLDILINNAGRLDVKHSATEITWSLIESIFSINTFSVLRLTSLCLPLLEKAESSCIINITSVSLRTGAPTATVYAAAKAAIDSFTRGLATELAPRIRVNAVAPGYIDTPFHEGLTSVEELESIKKTTPLQMIGKPEHITSTINFLINNSFMTGETIDVNGGLFMR